MFTLGGAISGYCSIGRSRIEPAPASMITIEITQAKIGRSTKTRESMTPSLLPHGRRRVLARARVVVRVDGHGLDRLTRLDLVGALDDQLVPGGETLAHEPLVVDGALELQVTLLDLALGALHERRRVAFR